MQGHYRPLTGLRIWFTWRDLKGHVKADKGQIWKIDSFGPNEVQFGLKAEFCQWIDLRLKQLTLRDLKGH